MPRVPRFQLQPADAAFLETAPKRYVGVFDVPRPAAEIWAELTRDSALDYCRMLGGARWTSARPFGVGTTRTMKVTPGLLVVEETFFRWEEGRRKSFYAHAASLPLFRRLAEDYLVEERSPTSCRFTWTIAGEPTALARPGAPVNAWLARSLFADTRKHFGAT
jgi:hypothetical protein